MRYTFIVNPRAGGRQGEVVGKRLQDRLRQWGVPHEMVVTRSPGEGERRAAERANRSDVVVAVGGDGTLHEVGNGLLKTNPDTLLGWIPAGTGNDFARTMNIPSSLQQALSLILAGSHRQIDVGRVNDRYFFNVSGVGFDARVAQEVSRSHPKIKGALAYALAALKILPRLTNPTLKVNVNGETFVDKTLLVVVGNCRYYGGGMMICPDAQEDDGLVDVCIAGNLGRLEVLRALTAAFKGKHVTLPKMQYHTSRRIEIDGPPDVLVHADGQIVGNLPVRYEVIPRALKLICPPPPGLEGALTREGTGVSL